MSAGELLGLGLAFTLCMVPSVLFIGALAGNVFRLPLWARAALSAAFALLMAVGIVFHDGYVEDPQDTYRLTAR
ncbi:MAG TPA: hypothetical protein VN667_14535 [Burkholderiales bacterium]|nr:hypothetical protein [Burkholderiales bacterium]